MAWERTPSPPAPGPAPERPATGWRRRARAPWHQGAGRQRPTPARRRSEGRSRREKPAPAPGSGIASPTLPASAAPRRCPPSRRDSGPARPAIRQERTKPRQHPKVAIYADAKGPTIAVLRTPLGNNDREPAAFRGSPRATQPCRRASFGERADRMTTAGDGSAAGPGSVTEHSPAAASRHRRSTCFISFFSLPRRREPRAVGESTDIGFPSSSGAPYARPTPPSPPPAPPPTPRARRRR